MTHNHWLKKHNQVDKDTYMMSEYIVDIVHGEHVDIVHLQHINIMSTQKVCPYLLR